MFSHVFALTLITLTGLGTESTFQVEIQPLDDPNAAPVLTVVVEDDRATPDQPLPLPVRVILTAADGSHPDASGRGTYADGRSFAEGSFTIEVPPGPLAITLRSGPNFQPLETQLDPRPGTRTVFRARLHRWFSPESLGWYGGDHHVHAQHDASAAVRTNLAYTALQARANGLSFVTEAGSNVDYSNLDQLSTPDFRLSFAPELRPGPFVGHLNTLGIHEPLPADLLTQFGNQPLPVQAIVDAAHHRGGAVIHTHPLTPPHQLHWMGAAEFLSDAVLGRTADALDLDGQATELLWATGLNLGNRVAASASTDAALGRVRTPSPGDRRVYVQAAEPSSPALVSAIRNGRTFATNGGPVFPYLTIDGRSPGDPLPHGAAARQVRAEIHSLHPLRSVQLLRRGVPVELLDTAGPRDRVVLTTTVEGSSDAPDWFALRAEDERGHWAITSPVFVGPRPDPATVPASAMILQISNATRFIELRRQFFAHLIVTSSLGDPLRAVELLRDGEVVHRVTPAMGNLRHEGAVPVTGLRGEYGPGAVWAPSPDTPLHLQADWPIDEPGWYALRATTASGRTLHSDELRFDGPTGASRATSVAHLDGPGTRLVHHGHGEEMPLDAIHLPFEGDHWWFPERTFWRMTATFDEHSRTLVGGSNPGADALFRSTAP
ncbi:CehA/McbA family metallohydrolase [Tautonia marina]|uniref:CehA/McbA family metallohydrolase n=1 Tax=Tautonia marina TaxID=2653855 RepID=UPI0013756EEE|nr:CehA/McbA family metallohydrolase [Tautonia marina]